MAGSFFTRKQKSCCFRIAPIEFLIQRPTTDVSTGGSMIMIWLVERKQHVGYVLNKSGWYISYGGGWWTLRFYGCYSCTHRQSRVNLTEASVPPGLEDQETRVDLAHGQLSIVEHLVTGNEEVQYLLGLQWPNVLDRHSEFIVSLIHFLSYSGGMRYRGLVIDTEGNKEDHSVHGEELPDRILIFKFSRMSAKRVVVNWTLPSSSTGMFIRISFL